MVYYYCGPYYSCRRREPSLFDGFTLSPLPYPVLLILIVVAIFIAIKSVFTFEVPEVGEFQINWLLLATPLIIIFAVKFLSSYQRPSYYKGPPPYAYGYHKWAYCGGPSPWEAPNPWRCYPAYSATTYVGSTPVYVPN